MLANQTSSLIKMSRILAALTSVVLLCIGFQTSNAQARDVKKEYKAVDSTFPITCPGCENGGPCFINDVKVDQNDDMLLNNGTVILPPNLFGNITCGGNMENLTEYLICPPIDGVYDWLVMNCSATTVITGDEFNCYATFPWLPHNGISMFVNMFVSGDADIRCSSDNVMGQVVHYTCIALNPSRKSLRAQVSFCGIGFNSSTLNVTIKDQPALNSSNISMTSSNINTAPSSMITPMATANSSLTVMNSTITSTAMVTESPVATVGTDTVNNNGNDDGGPYAGLIVGVVLFSATIVIIIIATVAISYIKNRKSNHHNTEDGNDLQTRNDGSQAPSNGDIHTPNDVIHDTTDNEDEGIHDTPNEDFQAPNGVIPTPNDDTHDTPNGGLQTPIGNLRTSSPDGQIANERSDVPTTSFAEHQSCEQLALLVVGTDPITQRETHN